MMKTNANMEPGEEAAVGAGAAVTSFETDEAPATMASGAVAKRPVPVALLVGAVLLVVGIAGVAMQLSEGLSVSAGYPFGLYLAAFFCLVGAACGLLMMALGAEFGLFDCAGKNRLFYAGALSVLIAAGCTITFLDCGQPLRVFSMIVSTNPTSMVSWDFYFLAATAIVSAVGIFKPCKAVAVIGSLLALGIVVVEAMILIVTSGTPHWNNPMLVLLFLVDAVTLGSALFLFSAKRDFPRVRFALGVALSLTAVMLLSDIASGIYTGDAAMATLISGPFAGLFWIMLIAGIIAPLVVVVVARGNVKAAKVAAVMALAGVFLDKLTLLLAGQAIAATGEISAYTPGMVEFMGVAGSVGLAIVLYVLLSRGVSCCGESAR